MSCQLLSTLVVGSLFIHTLCAEENFLLIDGITNKIVVELGPHIDERVTPASSFKIVLSLMGYDTGILKDQNTPTWHCQEGYDDFLDSWKDSQTPQSWMTRSCVWYSKLLGLQLGLERIQNYLTQFDYGNQDVSSGLGKLGSTNPAWISSSLTISPREQVNFIQKMVHGNLPISTHALEMTKRLVFKEELPEGWKLYGKTGLGTTIIPNGTQLYVRWFIGWIENDLVFFPFAYQMRAREIDVSQVIPRVKQLLFENISYDPTNNARIATTLN